MPGIAAVMTGIFVLLLMYPWPPIMSGTGRPSGRHAGARAWRASLERL
jgi:hypothetical protein